jgi:hypothetical protein
MNKRIKKKKKTQETKLLHKICKDIKRICNNYTFHYSSVPDSEKFSDLIEAFEKMKSGAETLEKSYTTSSDIKNIHDTSIKVTLPESGLKVEILKDRHNPFVSWKGIPPHLRLAALYNAAYPTQMKMTDDEAAMYLHNCMGEIRRINGKNLYIDNIFDDVIDSTQYNIHHGHQMMQQVLSNLRKRLYENWEKGIPVDGFPDVDVSIPEDVIDEIRKETKAAIDNILGLSKDEEK